MDQIMSCSCDASGISSFNVRMTIEEDTTTTQNAVGEQVPSWNPIGSSPHVWASYVKNGGREFFAAQQINPQISGVVRMRYRSSITPRNRLRIKGTSRILEIVSGGDPDESRQFLVFMVKEAQA